MVYLDNTSGWQAVALPRLTDRETEGEWSLTLTQKVSNVAAVVPRLRVTDDGGYYAVSLRLLEQMSEGEYVYSLTRGGAVVSRGLAVIGEYHESPVTTPIELTIKQYGE